MTQEIYQDSSETPGSQDCELERCCVEKHDIYLNGILHSLFLDENRGRFRYLRFDDKVDWIRARVQLILIDPCREALKEAETNYLGLVAATAICAGISAAGSFMHGDLEQWRGKKVRDSDRFKRFIKTYMTGPKEQMPKKLWAVWLYSKVRCGLAHGFTIEEGGIDVALDQYVRRQQNGPQMNPNRLLEDFDAAWGTYLDHVRARGPRSALGRRFRERFDSIYRD